ncbi:MAG TPA: hypothetical protein VJH20_03060 [Candidatus Nanoarchaeia archaeon]|nr:hypothetical protein [Candidatus Nanoarchaeia archaeon]
MDKQELINKLGLIRKDISNLKDTLERIRKEKDSIFQKRNSLREKVAGQIKEIKELKSKKDKDSFGLQDEFREKDVINQEIGTLINKIKALNEKRRIIKKEVKIDKNPDMLKSLINKLEEKIETEVLSIEEEKRVMKRLNKLKSEYKEIKVIVDLNNEYNKMSEDIDFKKKKLNDLKNKIKDNMEKNSEYEGFMKISKEIFETKNEISALNNQYFQYKSDILKNNILLKEKLKELNDIKNDLDLIDKKLLEEKENKKQDIISQKKSVVEEKLRMGHKLSTEDLITFQASK